MKSEMGAEGLLYLVEMAKVSHLKPFDLVTVLTNDDECGSRADILDDCQKAGLLALDYSLSRHHLLGDEEIIDWSIVVWGFK